jgi:hypothetical protein
MFGDFVAPARRVASYIFEGLFQELSPDGLTLYAAMLRWAVTPPPPYTPLRTGEFFEHRTTKEELTIQPRAAKFLGIEE